MAASSVTVVVKQSYLDGKMYNVIGTLAIGAGPLTYVVGGLPVNFNDPLIKAQRTPVIVWIQPRAQQAGQGKYSFVYIPGSNNTNGLLKIFNADVELTAAAIPIGVSGDIIDFEAQFLGMN